MIKEGNIYTYFVDPKERIIQHRQISKENWYEEMRSAIGCRLIETVKVLDVPKTRWYGDEEGLLKNDEEKSFFKFSTVQNLSTGNNVINNTRIIKGHKEVWSSVQEWEFCGRAFFTGCSLDEESTVDTIRLHLWEFAQCVEFMHDGYTVEPKIQFINLAEGNF